MDVNKATIEFGLAITLSVRSTFHFDSAQHLGRSIEESKTWKRKRQMRRFPLERSFGPVHIDHEEKEDDHDGQFEKRRKFDETREGKIWKRI